jgi:hypothetical protein
VRVPSIDLAAWLRTRFCATDLLVVKLDIEGGEWELLAHLLEGGAAHLIDFLAVEWHVAQRSAGGVRERRRLRAWQTQLEARLLAAGVRTLRSWDADSLRSVLARHVKTTEVPTTVRATRKSESGGCDGPPDRRQRCCSRHPRANGCSACRWSTRHKCIMTERTTRATP